MSTLFCIFLYNIKGISRNHQLFVGRNQKKFYFGIFCGNDGFFSSHLVLDDVHLDAQVAQICTD